MTNIFCHYDADGLVSAYFTKFHLKKAKIVVTDEFGDVDGWQKDDWMVDMRPVDPNIEGTVIDHHPNHPGVSERRYKLIWENIPASLIAWKQFKKEIPKSEWWKVVIGISGDGQTEKIPYEIFDICPELLFKTSVHISKSYGKWKLSTFPIYKLLSSPINAFARYGEYQEALELIHSSKSPLDIISSPSAVRKKEALRKVFESVIEMADVYDFGNLTLVIFYSPEVRLSGYIASSIGSDVGTVMAVNSADGSLSLRGDLSLYFKEKLSKLKYIEIDGHPGFMGGKITESPKRLVSDLFSIL